MKALEPDELELLKRVKTTKAQARRILKRNLGLLEALDKIPTNIKDMKRALADGQTFDYRGDVGCPHCNSAYDCEGCAWQEAVEEPEEGPVPPPVDRACADAFFGGMSLYDLDEHYIVEINYRSGEEELIFYLEEDCEPDADDMKLARTEISRCRKFLQGHVDWANYVLEQGGTP